MASNYMRAWKIIMVILFMVCLLPMPYGYYQFVRFWGMSFFIVLSFIEKQNKRDISSIIFILIAILLNPFYKIALGRMMWNIVDIALSALIVLTLIRNNRR